MADIGGSHNAAFSDGLNFTQNTGKANAGSITLGTDTGLDQTSERWSSMTPHGVVHQALNAGSQGDDSSFERLQRDSSGGYQPGSMATFQDQIDQGSNDNAP